MLEILRQEPVENQRGSVPEKPGDHIRREHRKPGLPGFVKDGIEKPALEKEPKIEMPRQQANAKQADDRERDEMRVEQRHGRKTSQPEERGDAQPAHQFEVLRQRGGG